MSTVYRAFDTVLERQVAIKLLHREIAGDVDQLERFRREARAVAQLNHPHVVGVIDAGQEDDGPYVRPYIVFEYVEGETLKDRIRRHGRLPIDESVAYAIEIARALGAAHERGIVHRDVKPQNVLVDEEGSAKVTDFGIARTLDQEGLTADGRVLGTTDYVSPEQALGRPVTGQSDLYSLGIVLFEMLTGDVPFKGENQVAVAMKHVREDLPDVQIRRPEVPSALAAIVDRATDKDLDRRYADDAEIVADLEHVLADQVARSGQTTGEATQVLRTLPRSAQRRIARGVLHPPRLIPLLALIAVAAVAIVVLSADRAQRGTQQRPVVKPQPGLAPVSLGQSRARDYDPQGGDGEHPEQARLVLDDDTGTSWATERYNGGTLNGKDGVGIYLDARPSARARELQLVTPTPGWSGKVYARDDPPTNTWPDPGWKDVGTITDAKPRTTVKLHGKDRARYYLLWISKFAPGQARVEISELVLLQQP
jgi:serine/threonine-protein kinase